MTFTLLYQIIVVLVTLITSNKDLILVQHLTLITQSNLYQSFNFAALFFSQTVALDWLSLLLCVMFVSKFPCLSSSRLSLQTIKLHCPNPPKLNKGVVWFINKTIHQRQLCIFTMHAVYIFAVVFIKWGWGDTLYCGKNCLTFIVLNCYKPGMLIIIIINIRCDKAEHGIN